MTAVIFRRHRNIEARMQEVEDGLERVTQLYRRFADLAQRQREAEERKQTALGRLCETVVDGDRDGG